MGALGHDQTALNYKQSLEALMLQSDWIILQQEIPQVSNQAVLTFAREHGLPVLLNYAPAHDLSLHLDAGVHGLVVNERAVKVKKPLQS